MKIAIIITAVLGLICTTGLRIGETKLNKFFLIGTTLFMIVLYFLGVCSVVDKDNIIPAIEVYRGNTVLQITYQDSIPIDSVVVYKNK